MFPADATAGNQRPRSSTCLQRAVMGHALFAGGSWNSDPSYLGMAFQWPVCDVFGAQAQSLQDRCPSRMLAWTLETLVG